MSKRPNRSTASLVILLLLAAVLMFLIFRVPDSSVDMKYSQVLSYFKDEKVKSFTFDLNDGTLTLTMSAADAKAALEETQKLNSNSTTNSILGSLSALEPTVTSAPDSNSGAQAQEKDQQLTYKVPYADLFITQVLPYVEEYNDAHPDAPMVYDILPQQKLFCMALHDPHAAEHGANRRAVLVYDASVWWRRRCDERRQGKSQRPERRGPPCHVC